MKRKLPFLVPFHPNRLPRRSTSTHSKSHHRRARSSPPFRRPSRETDIGHNRSKFRGCGGWFLCLGFPEGIHGARKVKRRVKCTSCTRVRASRRVAPNRACFPSTCRSSERSRRRGTVRCTPWAGSSPCAEPAFGLSSRPNARCSHVSSQPSSPNLLQDGSKAIRRRRNHLRTSDDAVCNVRTASNT